MPKHAKLIALLLLATLNPAGTSASDQRPPLCRHKPSAIDHLNDTHNYPQTAVTGYGMLTAPLRVVTKDNQHKAAGTTFKGILFENGKMVDVDEMPVAINVYCINPEYCDDLILNLSSTDALMLFHRHPSTAELSLQPSLCGPRPILETDDFDPQRAAKCLSGGNCTAKDLGL